MKKVFLFFAVVLAPVLTMAQEEQSGDNEHYVVSGAKIGKKIGRQVVQSNYDRTPASVEYMYGESGYHRPLSFVGAMDGAVVGTLAHSYTYQNYYHGKRGINYRKKQENSTDISALEIANITYADDNGDGLVEKDETAQIYFDLINTGDTPLLGVTPVLLAQKTKHLLIADPAPIDTLQAKSALRYVIELSGDGKSNAGKSYLLLRIRYGHNQYADIQEICLGGKK